MKVTEKKLKRIIRNIVTESMLPGREQMVSLSKMLRKQFPETIDRGHRFMVHSDGINMEPEHLVWLLSQKEYRNTSFKVLVDSRGGLYVLFDL